MVNLNAVPTNLPTRFCARDAFHRLKKFKFMFGPRKDETYNNEFRNSLCDLDSKSRS